MEELESGRGKPPPPPLGGQEEILADLLVDRQLSCLLHLLNHLSSRLSRDSHPLFWNTEGGPNKTTRESLLLLSSSLQFRQWSEKTRPRTNLLLSRGPLGGREEGRKGGKLSGNGHTRERRRGGGSQEQKQRQSRENCVQTKTLFIFRFFSSSSSFSFHDCVSLCSDSSSSEDLGHFATVVFFSFFSLLTS